MTQGIFISYRRDTGSTMARMIYDRLRLEKNYKCFLDVEKLNVGNFHENIVSELDKCRIFVLILSKNALDRCVNPDDVVRKEILVAMEKGLEVIPVTSEDFKWPETMPEGLEGLNNFNAIPYIQVYSDRFFERLYSFIENVFAKDRARENAIRSAEFAAKRAEFTTNAKDKLKTIGKSSASTISDFSKATSKAAKNFVVESVQEKKVNPLPIAVGVAVIAVLALVIVLLGSRWKIIIPIAIVALGLVIYLWRKKNPPKTEVSGEDPAGVNEAPNGTEQN